MHFKDRPHLFVNIFKTLSWALDILKKYRGRLHVYIFLLILQAVYQIFMTSKVGNVVDLALIDDVHNLLLTGSYLLLLFVLNILFTVGSTRFASHTYNSMYNDLELIVYRKIMDASWEGLDEYHSGDLITRLYSDVKTVAGNTSGLVPTMISKLTLIFGAACFIIYIDFSMLFLVLIIGPIVIIASRIFMGRIYDSEAKIKEMESLINSYNVETFDNIHAVKAFGLGNFFFNKMQSIEIKRKKIDLKTNRYILCSYAVSYLALLVGAGIAIGWMFYRVHFGNLSFGGLSVMVSLALQIGLATEALLDLVPVIMEYIASADRLKKLLSISDEKDAFCAEDTDKFINEAIDKGVSIYVKNAWFKYKNGYCVFNGVSFCAQPGEIIALVGPSGEGKTTMLRILLGIVGIYKGRAYAALDGNEIDLGLRTRALISYVPQGNTMMAGTIIDNLKMVNNDATELQIKDVLETACIYDFVNGLPDGFMHELGQGGRGVSEGQNQRLSIARALLKDAPVLLMDEATSALDVATERRIFENIKEKYPNKTIIITTHRPTVLSMCNRVYRISEKRIKLIGVSDIQKLIDEF